MSLRAPVRRVVLPAALVAVVAAAAWTGWQAWQLNNSLNDAVDDAAVLEEALRTGDRPAAAEALESLQSNTHDARQRTDGYTWSALTRLPVVGDDADGLRTVSGVVAELTDDAIAPLVDEAADLDSLVPKDGRIPVDGIREMQGPVTAAAASFAAADTRLAAVDPSGYIDRLREQYDELASRVHEVSGQLGAADTAVRVMPSMLGADGPRSYLLVFQNNAEVRATGGLPGAAALVEAEDGRLTMTDYVAGSALGETPTPVLPLSPAEREIFGPQLGTYFLDANFTPHFPRAAELWQARWEQDHPDIDGVLAVDPIAMGYLLGVTGPIQVGDVELNAGNAASELMSGVYQRIPDPSQQDVFFETVAKAVFERVVSGGADPRAMLEALSHGAGERRLLVHSFDETEQSALAGTTVAGEVNGGDPERARIGVFLNDNTGAKMSYYLRMSTTVVATSCTDGVQTIEGTATLESLAPPDAASLPEYVTGGGTFGIDPGYQMVAVRFYGPEGGTVDEVAQDGDAFKDIPIVPLDGRPVATSYVELGPGDRAVMSWTMTSAPGQTGDVDFLATPTLDPSTGSYSVPGAC